MPSKTALKTLLAVLALSTAPVPFAGDFSTRAETAAKAATIADSQRIRYKTEVVDGIEIFYREAGSKNAPAVLLLHGFPTSSHMFRNLIPALADKYRVIAPDYPGFGYSGQPERGKFAYTFDNYAQIVEQLTQKIGLSKYALYVMDYGAPVGFRLAAKRPDRVSALIVQNGNAYQEGLREFWDPIRAYWKTGAQKERDALRPFTKLEATKWQYTTGVKDQTLLSPDAWTHDQVRLDKPDNAEIQLDLFLDYRTNVPLYPQWQAYFRKHQPAAIVIWGKNDLIFPAQGAVPYKRDLPDAELHLIDTGHFLLESHGEEAAALIREFLGRKLK
jgi:pimeloyl-ACP methyl ester carboxylesterase